MSIEPSTLPAQYQPADNLLSNKVIVVTGAGDGIGRSAAKHFAAHGATVVLVGKTIEKLEAVYDEIEASGHPQPAIYPIHLNGAVTKDYQDMANALDEAFGRIDGVLHNAGQLGDRRPVAQCSVEVWQEVMQVNVNAAFMMTQALMPLMERARYASIVFTSSSVGRRGRAYWGAYAVSKFATEGLMQTLADELDQTSAIRCNAINPGATNTSMRRTAYPGEHPAKNPDPDHIMPLYLYLMGDDSLEINGQSFDAQPK